MNIEKPESIDAIISDLNNEISYSLTTLSPFKKTPEELKAASQLATLRDSDIMAISSMARILISQSQHQTDQEIASKLIKELSNSHPNRFIKKICKKMAKQKWGEKHETE
ncbi:hypothetical protein F7984_09875 [Pradoshia sp. D12]|uniref:hypothetical protein n=1 Tax=Bacillaceae TaxID=186817 RepID=UPI00080ACCE5|nr:MULTISPECIES: hypothetical protein [Bacillaceae]OCA86706.1 hypothetical protein A8L44_05300 [Bacillus sp. FJAT-27986]QFK71522.1 hypothetical protein F7984_09875 [Pradoshia sp. D12]TPF73317.1 hypothetical protein FHY44_06270 [Bacillus sp. D12]